MKFRCIKCTFQTEIEECIPDPEGWFKRNYARVGQYRHLCYVCGAFMYPIELNHLRKSPTGTYQLYEMFSICRFAPLCAKHQIYKPSCERQVLTTDCLFALHKEFSQAQEALFARMDKLEKLYSSLAQAKTSPHTQEPETPRDKKAKKT